MTNMKIIHAHIYDPRRPSLFGKAPANEKAQLFLVRCDNTDKCDLYKLKKCTRRKAFGSCCPYGKNDGIYGSWTRRAKKFSTQINKWYEKYPEVNDSECSLSAPDHKIAKVGDYYYLPYSHMFHNNKKVEVLEESGFFRAGVPFIHKDNFDGETIISLVNHRPHAMMGGEIASYQREEVPLFVVHLYENYPDLFNEANKIQDLSKYIKEVDYVGRYAYVKTLKVGCTVIKHNGEPFLWDGEYLIAQSDKISFPIIDDFDELILKFKPSDSSAVKITNNNQVDSTTKFKD
jgi:hypothetical protein